MSVTSGDIMSSDHHDLDLTLKSPNIGKGWLKLYNKIKKFLKI